MRSIILVTPPDSPLAPNKHYELFYNVLRKHGYEVYPFTFANVCRYNRRAIWHIHWIDLFHQGVIQRTRVKRHFAVISFLRFVNFLLSIALSKIAGTKIVWTIHNVVSHERPGSFFESLVTKFLLFFADKVTALNTHIRNTISEHYGFSDIALMRQGLYEGCYKNTVTREQARQRLGLHNKDFVLLFLGSVVEYKGIDVAIEALHLLSDDSVKLVISGKLRRGTKFGDRIVELSSGNRNVILVDRFISDDEVQVYFKAADYSIYPYRSIDNSGPLYLTLAFEVPTIMRSLGGVPEVLSLNPRVWIPLFELDSQSIAGAISEARMRKVEKTDFAIFKETLSWSKLETEIVECFEELQK
jgi:glycosyltransferase involved in cell wall biosynthesis